MYGLNATHDPALKSWVAGTHHPGTDFPIQNLPFGVVRRRGSSEPWRGAVAIGGQALDLAALHALRLVRGTPGDALEACADETLNRFMALGQAAWSSLREVLSGLLRAGAPQAAILQQALLSQSEIEFSLPARIGDFTDFYSSLHHATTVGRLFRPDNPLLPNYKWVPIAYHGRASSIGISGQSFARPAGQVLPAGAARPELMATRRLDYELELGILVGTGNAPGIAVSVDRAEEHVFGVCLLNDWSARDIQAWEYQPLGPFLAKNFATTLSPWVVTLEALEPFRVPWSREAADPQPLPYLDAREMRSRGAIDIQLEAYILTERMRATGAAPQRLSHSSFQSAYWSIAQMLAHHTINGCNLQTGDLIGSGTQSGPQAGQGGSLLELSAGGKQALPLTTGETRTFVADGDTISFRGWCEKSGYARIGLGEVAATVLPARQNAK
ncbi:MAG TPA: fumarylacetoacetase [Steroidobacteraceae bacterium]